MRPPNADAPYCHALVYTVQCQIPSRRTPTSRLALLVDPNVKAVWERKIIQRVHGKREVHQVA
jgi:hypothetical protein